MKVPPSWVNAANSCVTDDGIRDPMGGLPAGTPATWHIPPVAPALMLVKDPVPAPGPSPPKRDASHTVQVGCLPQNAHLRAILSWGFVGETKEFSGFPHQK